MRNGIANIPEDRIKDGLLMESPIRDNLILGYHWNKEFCIGGFLSSTKIGTFSDAAFKNYEIAAPNAGHKTRLLSGGNLQKVILAREMSHEPGFLLANQPTRGLDVGAIEYVQRRLLDLRDAGAGILMISEELDEIFGLSDYIAVMYRGQITGILKTNETDIEELGCYMAGIRNDFCEA
jgi:simple sugar transport system ATP-binding protein